MSTIALDTAFDLLRDNQNNGTILQVTGFVAGDAFDFEPDSATTFAQGNVVFTGGITDIKFVPFSTDSVILQCMIEHDQPEMVVGNIIIYVNNQPCFMFVSPRKFENRKLQSNGTAVGIKYTVQILVTIPAIMTRMSFVNLPSGVASFKIFNNLEVLDNFYQTEQDQAVINEYKGRPVPILNMLDGWYGCPLAMHNSDVKFWKLSGGEVGDDYAYVKDQ